MSIILAYLSWYIIVIIEDAEIRKYMSELFNKLNNNKFNANMIIILHPKYPRKVCILGLKAFVD